MKTLHSHAAHSPLLQGPPTPPPPIPIPRHEQRTLPPTKADSALLAPSWTSPIFSPRNLELELRDLQVTENEDCRHSGKESTCQCRRSKRYMDSIPGSRRFLGEGNGNSLQYSCLENPMDRGAWWVYSPWGHKELDMTERLHFHFLSL